MLLLLLLLCRLGASVLLFIRCPTILPRSPDHAMSCLSNDTPKIVHIC